MEPVTECKHAKRQKVDNESSSSATAPASEPENEPMVSFNAEHFGGGLNDRFDADDAVSMFAGGDDGGGGLFESAEGRGIAASADQLVEVLLEHGLKSGCTVLDVGAGTGLLLSRLSKAAGTKGQVLAIDLSLKYVTFMQKRVARDKLRNVAVSKCSAKSTELTDMRGQVAQQPVPGRGNLR